MVHFFFRSLTVLTLAFFLVSCGKAPSNILTGVKVGTETKDEDIWMSFSADLNLGAMQFATISVPVLHPRGQTPIGHLDLISGFGGANQLKISVNVSELADVEMTRTSLPNGNLVPLIANNSVIAVDIGKGAKLYLALSESVTAIGVAVPIRAFDNIGQTLPGLNIFPVVSTGDVIGTAGVFTGSNSGENGIAVVADVSKVVNLGNLLAPRSAMMALQAEEARDSLKLDYRSHEESRSEKAKFDKMIYKLNKKRAILRMH